jgi:hypothetical protein
MSSDDRNKRPKLGYFSREQLMRDNARMGEATIPQKFPEFPRETSSSRQQQFEVFNQGNSQELRDVVARDFFDAQERLEERAQAQSKTNIDKWSMRALLVLALYSAAQVRYQPARVEAVLPDTLQKRALEAKGRVDLSLPIGEIQIALNNIDTQFQEPRFIYGGRELTQEELDIVLNERFPEWNLLKDIANHFLVLFDEGVSTIYQPVQEIVDSMTSLLGQAGKALAYAGISIFTLLAGLFVYNSRKIGLGVSASSAVSTQLQPTELISGIVRIEDRQGIPHYLTMAQILKTIDESNVPVVNSFFNIFYDFVFENNFPAFSPEPSRASSSASSVSSISSLSSVQSEGLYGFGDLDGIARITEIGVSNLLRFGAFLYGGLENVVSKFGGEMAELYESCDEDLPSVSCKSQSVVSVVATTMQKNRLKINRDRVPPELLPILDYGSGSDFSRNSSQNIESRPGSPFGESGGRKSRKHRRKARKTKKAKKVKKTKKAKKVKKVFVLKGGKKSKRSRR